MADGWKNSPMEMFLDHGVGEGSQLENEGKVCFVRCPTTAQQQECGWAKQAYRPIVVEYEKCRNPIVGPQENTNSLTELKILDEAATHFFSFIHERKQFIMTGTTEEARAGIEQLEAKIKEAHRRKKAAEEAAKKKKRKRKPSRKNSNAGTFNVQRCGRSSFEATFGVTDTSPGVVVKFNLEGNDFGACKYPSEFFHKENQYSFKPVLDKPTKENLKKLKNLRIGRTTFQQALVECIFFDELPLDWRVAKDGDTTGFDAGTYYNEKTKESTTTKPERDNMDDLSSTPIRDNFTLTPGLVASKFTFGNFYEPKHFIDRKYASQLKHPITVKCDYPTWLEERRLS